jgi:methionine-rich copper-binding protein CopC
MMRIRIDPSDLLPVLGRLPWRRDEDHRRRGGRGEVGSARSDLGSVAAALVVRAAAVALLLTLVLVGRAGAHHADLVRAAPAPGARVMLPDPIAPASPLSVEVRAWFNLPLIVPGSGLAVTDATGGRVDDGQQRHVDGDPHALAVRLVDPRPGAYTVTWRVTAETDFDYAQGSYGFELIAARGGWVGREGVLALALGLLSLAVVRAAGPTADR